MSTPKLAELPPLVFEDVSEDTSSADDIHVPLDAEPDDFLPDRALTAPYEERKTKDDKVRAGPPLLDEWQDFFSRIVVKSATNFYIEAAFRGIDEDRLSDTEIERIRLSEDERNRIARPFAEFANKNKWMRKHGRAVIAGAGMSDSFIALGMWVRRVNRIARKYRPVRGSNVSSGQSEPASNGYGYAQRYFSPGG